MEVSYKEEFEHNNQNYEIRVCNDGRDFTVNVFLDNAPADGYSYSVDDLTKDCLKSMDKFEAIKYLVDLAKENIINETWGKYLEAHRACLQMNQEQLLECRQCGSRDVTISSVDQRQMYECRDCQNIWYGSRGWTNGCYTILDEIIEGIASTGSHEIDAAALLNLAFRCNNESLPFNDQLKIWAGQNKLNYSFFTKGKQQSLRFWR